MHLRHSFKRRSAWGRRVGEGGPAARSSGSISVGSVPHVDSKCAETATGWLLTQSSSGCCSCSARPSLYLPTCPRMVYPAAGSNWSHRAETVLGPRARSRARRMQRLSCTTMLHRQFFVSAVYRCASMSENGIILGQGNARDHKMAGKGRRACGSDCQSS